MARDTLIDFFNDLASARGDFLVHDDGYRTGVHGYAEVGRAARAFAARLAAAGVRQHDRVVIWGENRPEWVVALWGALLGGIVAVPIDYRVGADFVVRVRRIVEARLVVVGDDVPPAPGLSGDDASIDGVPAWRLSSIDWHAAATVPAVPIASSDTAEIMFTSGATADPRGVVITHRNILANLVPIEQEVLKYRRYGRPFFPLRFLNLLPLSHMFGQAMATFIPPMLPGTCIFMSGYNPHEIVRQIHQRRVSVLVSVPKMLEVLRDHVLRLVPSAADPPPARMHWTRRWWKYRKVHQLFGWKFWSFVVGAAPLDPALEEFWSRLGFAVIQGYGLTETAPIVTLNHPFSTRRGSVGKPLHGLELRLAPDGEILVRGDNVTSGYFNAPEATAAAFEDGWLRTGDIGEIDESGRVYVRGRKKEMIVTPEGLNVFPDDVERVLDDIPGVRESGVVGSADGSEERVHAVLVLDPGADLDEVIRQANARLADHQRIRGASRWPGSHLPRTEGTRKLKRVELRTWLRAGGGDRPAPPGGEGLDTLLARYARGRPIGPETTIEELGLSSLERVELMVAIEQRFQTTVDEGAFARAASVGDLRGLIDAGAAEAGPAAGPTAFPAWNRNLAIRAFRRVSLGLLLPLLRVFAWIRVDGRRHLEALDGPVVFAANHQSHLDTPAILAALPARWRYRLAIAMAKEFFSAHFHPAGHTRAARAINSLLYYLAVLFFNAFPLPQREAGARDALRYMGDLAGAGCSILIFPEGARTEAGEIHTFRAGVGMIGSRLGLPVVPVRLEGLDRVLHHTWWVPRPGRVRVAFGPPRELRGDDYGRLAAEVEAAVRSLGV